VTNRPGDARRLFDFYEGRGQAENYIKELKNQLKADRLSCHRFVAYTSHRMGRSFRPQGLSARARWTPPEVHGQRQACPNFPPASA
ncbi:MAG: transposase, partial [Armatimonadetes bacterium]|nr:transposase [Armatimonadota bacterium]